MRLRQSRLKPVDIYSVFKKTNGYVGTTATPVYKSSFKGDIQPLNDKMSAEIYGERVKTMLNIYCPTMVEIKEGDILAINGGKEVYKIVSIMSYSSHMVVTVDAG